MIKKIIPWISWLLVTGYWLLVTASPVWAIETELGDIPTDPQGLVIWILKFAIGIASGVSLLLVMYGGIKLISGSGDPIAIVEAKEIITNAIAGFLMVVFSVLLLKVIGYDILNLRHFMEVVKFK